MQVEDESTDSPQFSSLFFTQNVTNKVNASRSGFSASKIHFKNFQ